MFTQINIELTEEGGGAVIVSYPGKYHPVVDHCGTSRRGRIFSWGLHGIQS